MPLVCGTSLFLRVILTLLVQEMGIGVPGLFPCVMIYKVKYLSSELRGVGRGWGGEREGRGREKERRKRKEESKEKGS